MPTRPSRLFAAALTIYRVKSTTPLLGRFDAIVVEASGTDDPQVIAESLVFDNDIAHLDTIVTVVDAESFSRDYASTDSLSERGLASDDHDDRTVVEALIAQIEFCDVIVI